MNKSPGTKVENESIFYDAFSCQCLVVSYMVKLLDVNSILACLRVSKPWYDLWSSDHVWMDLFRQRFFPLDLTRVNHKLIPVLFHHVPYGRLVHAMYKVQCLVDTSTDMTRTLLDIERPKFTRDTLYMANFVDSAQASTLPQRWGWQPKRYLDYTVRLQEDWEMVYLPRLRTMSRAFEEMARDCWEMPAWLAEIVPTVTYRRVTPWGTVNNMAMVELTFQCCGLPFLFAMNSVLSVGNVRVSLSTTAQPQYELITTRSYCERFWVSNVVRDLKRFIADQVATGMDAEIAQSQYVKDRVTQCCPHFNLARLAEHLLPVSVVVSESSRLWWSRFVHALMGDFSPHTEYDLIPPHLNNLYTLEHWKQVLEMYSSSDEDD